MYNTLKGKFIIIALFTLSISFILVPVSFASFGVKEGDWAKYEITATSTEGSEELLEDFGEIELIWFRIEVKTVSSDAVTLDITAHYLNGTEDTETLDAGDLGFIVEAGLKEGDSIIAPFIEEDTYINGTVSREYAGMSRTDSYINLSEGEEGITATYSSYFDQTTGVMCEMSLSFIIDMLEEHYEATITYKLIETNMFTPTSLMEESWFYPAIGVVAIVVIGATIFFYRRSTQAGRSTPFS